MRNRIQKLCKRLSRFTLEEISLIAELDETEIKPILQSLIKEEQLKYENNIYFYASQKQKTLILPQKFQYHTKEEIDMIVKCFCAEVELSKTYKILEPKKSCINNFNRYFREVIYNNQYEKLINYFNNEPKISHSRTFFEKTIYFYCYNNQVFISHKNLNTNICNKHSQKEVNRIKMVYSWITRHIDNSAYKKYVHLHVAEHNWRYKKEFKELYEDLFAILLLY